MELSDQTYDTDISPALPLEISAELAASVDAVLEGFAEGAELETALVVEASGALVSGISSQEMMVEIISALVAGASGAMSSLVKELGSSGNIESFHQSEDRSVYLAEIMDRFILVGVSTVPVLVGVIREMARQVSPDLIDLLKEIEIEAPDSAPAAKSVSLREKALARAAEKALEFPATKKTNIFYEDDATVRSEGLVEPPVQEDLEEVIEELPVEMEKPPRPVEPEPAGVIEYMDDESPEVVIEDAAGKVVDSPFEAEDDFEESSDGILTDSIFELEETDTPESIFETDDEDRNPDPEPLVEEAPPLETVFEAAEPLEEGEGLTSVFEIEEESEESLSDFESGDTDDAVMRLPEVEKETVVFTHDAGAKMSDEEELDDAEEEEAPASGPFYF
ncbi:MAG: roadblock/LC7 domain-containing protein [Verrucomicrobiales bacterium]|nr:roadblock/LC7 domain-containing protein [Verrucomicrobiales bacterium]